MRLVIHLGGSILSPDLMTSYSKLLAQLANQHRIYLVVGGGKLARQLIQQARTLGATEYVCDQIGILCSRLNALLVLGSLSKYTEAKLIQDYSELMRYPEQILVCGGMVPGQSTDTVAALIAEAIQAELMIKLTDVNGIYSSDPDLDPDASKYTVLNHAKLVEISFTQQLKAGSYGIMDPLAARILERSKIQLVVANGKDPGNLVKILAGEKIGTKVGS